MKDKIGTPTSIFSFNSKERGQFFSERKRQQEVIYDINKWKLTIFDEPYNDEYSGPCPKQILEELIRRKYGH